MRKFKSIFAVVFCFLAAGLVFAGCGEKNIDVSFKKETTQIVMGESYNPFQMVYFAPEDKSKIHFESGDETIAYITPDNRLVAQKTGRAVLYAYAGKNQLSYTFLQVEQTHIKFNAPVNLNYNQATGAIGWNLVYADTVSGPVLAPSYTIEISKNGVAPETFTTLTNSFALAEYGTYSVRVKANGGGVFVESDYQKTLTGQAKYFTFSLMSAPTQLSYNDESKTLTWQAAENPHSTLYKVFVNGINISGEGQTALVSTINTSAAGVYSLQVVALPSQGENFAASSEILNVTRLQTPELTFNNGILTWEALPNAEGYSLALNNQPAVLLDSLQSTYNLKNVAAGNHQIAFNTVANNSSLIFTSQPATLAFKKMETASIIYNPLTKTFSVENAVENSVSLQLLAGQTVVETNNDNTLVFNKATFEQFTVHAQILAENHTWQIDGDVATSFKIDGQQPTQINIIQNLQTPNLNYFEHDGKSYVSFAENNENSSYYWLLNNSEIALTETQNPNLLQSAEKCFLIGETAEIFTQLTPYDLSVNKTKTIENNILFLEANSKISIQKLSAPLEISLQNTANANIKNVQVEDEFNALIVSRVAIKVNNQQTAEIDLTSANNFSVLVNFVAKTTFDLINEVKTFYTSSSQSEFLFQKLNTPQNLAFDYSDKMLSWSAAQNAQSYDVLVGGAAAVNTSQTMHQILNAGAYQIKIVAIAPTFANVAAGTTNFLNSNPAEYEIYEATEIPNLDLALNSDGSITATWGAATGIESFGEIAYDVYLGQQKLTSLSQSELTFTIPANNFVNFGNYEIKIQIVSPNNDFFLPQNSTISKTVEKLSAPTTLNFSAENSHLLTAEGYNPLKMNGILLSVDLQESEILSQNLIDISTIAAGETRIINVGFVGVFDNAENKYFLNSSLSLNFTFTKLAAPTTLNYENGTFNWESLDAVIVGGLGTNFAFEYHTQIGTTEPTQTPPQQTTETTVNLNITNQTTFLIRELALNAMVTAAEGATTFLSSPYSEITVYQDNSVQNLEMRLAGSGDNEKVQILWNYTPFEKLTDNPLYAPNFKIQLFNKQTQLAAHSAEISTFFDQELQKYIYEYSIGDFFEAGTYSVIVDVLSNKTLPANSESITITKLAAPEKASLSTVRDFEISTQINSFVALLNESQSAIDLTGVGQISITGAFTATLTNDFSAAHSDFSSATFKLPLNLPEGSQQFFAVLNAILPSEITDGNYYLNSETATFNLVKLGAPTATYNSLFNTLNWEPKLGAELYDILIALASGKNLEIFGVATTSQSMEEYKHFLTTSGAYLAKVRALPNLATENAGDGNVAAQIVQASQTAQDGTILFVAGEFGVETTLQKLQAAAHISVLTEESDILQKNVTLSWHNTQNAAFYDVYVSTIKGELGEKVAEIEATIGDSTSIVLPSSTFENALTYYVCVVTKADGFISSQPSPQTQVTRLNACNGLQLNENLQLVWQQTAQTSAATLQFDYVVRVLNNANQVVFTSQPNTVPNNLFDITANAQANDFVANFAGGSFAAQVIIAGNGASMTAGTVATLSSALTQVDLYKFLAPTISLVADNTSATDKIIFKTTNTAANLGTEFDFVFSVIKKAASAGEADVVLINKQRISGVLGTEGGLAGQGSGANITTAEFILPAELAFGEFEIVAYVSPKNATKNFVESNQTNKIITKLNAPKNLILNALLGNQTNSAENILQTNLKISWLAVPNATLYKIYINGALAQTFVPENLELQTFEVLFLNALTATQTHQISIQAFAENFVRSSVSETLSAVRFNAFSNQNGVITNGAQVSQNLELSWVRPPQSEEISGYYLEIFATDGALLYSEIITNIMQTTYDLSTITALTDWLNAPGNSENAGKDFSVCLTILGNGTGNTSLDDDAGNSITSATQATLSSITTKVLVHKLATPTLQIQNDTVVIASADDATYASKFEYHYTITIGGVEFASGIYNGGIAINTEWQNGSYEITAVAKPKQNVVNLIASNIQTLQPKKLQQVENVRVESVSGTGNATADLEQINVNYYFSSVENATNYDIYINDVFFNNIQTTATGEIKTDAFDNLSAAGTYKIKVVAKAPGLISSAASAHATAIRLNPLQNASLNNQTEVSWGNVLQNSAHYGFALNLISLATSGQQVQGTGHTINSQFAYAGFANNAWLLAFDGGAFKINIYAEGNGVPNVGDGITTLTSSALTIDALKLFAPEIAPAPDHLVINNNTSVAQIPSGELASESSFVKYSALYGEQAGSQVFACDASGNPLNDVLYNENNQLYWPEAWQSGSYTFLAKAHPNADVLNVISSNENRFISIRLDAPTGVKFYRDSAINSAEYSSDEQNFDAANYLNPNMFLGFDAVAHAMAYSVANVNTGASYEIPYQFTNAELLGDLNNVVRGGFGARSLSLHVIAEGGAIINSPKTYLNYEVLTPVKSFKTSNGMAIWNNVANSLFYLVKASDINGAQRFWQNNATTTQSILSGILQNLQSGQIAFNIKALGNVDKLASAALGTQTSLITGNTIYLDSEYMNTDTEFVKLATPSDFGVNLGFLTFNFAKNATAYFAEIYDEDNSLVNVLQLINKASEFSDILTNFDFIAYASEIYNNLTPNVLYKVKIQAQNFAENYISSDYTSEINIKVLPNVNQVGDIKLTFADDMRLDQTFISAYAAENSYGNICFMNGSFMIDQTQNTKLPSLSPKKININFADNTFVGASYSFILKVGSLGSSAKETDGVTDFYYLTSSLTTSQEIKVLPCSLITIENGVINWTLSAGADGYYVYINNNLYGGKMFTENYLALPNMYGGDENTDIKIKVVAVSESLDYLYSPTATYMLNLETEENIYQVLANLIKLKTPSNLLVLNGGFVWENGLTSIEKFDELTLQSALGAHATKEDVVNLQKYLISLLSIPLVVYSEYTGFSLPQIEMQFSNVLTSEKFSIKVGAEQFLDVSSAQKLALENLAEVVENLLNAAIAEISAETFVGEDKDYLLSYYTTIITFFKSQQFKSILALADKQIGWPNKNLLFEELAYSQAQIPAGEYTLSLRQVGNNLDWLNSNLSNQTSVFIPDAPKQFGITIEEGNFILRWNEVSIPQSYNYSPPDTNTDGVGEKYILFAKDKHGNRFEILRTNGTNGHLLLNLSELVNNNLITSEYVAIYMVVAGDGTTIESGKVLQGLKSAELEISVLPQVSPYMNDGVLVWDGVPSAAWYNILATAEGYEQLKFYNITSTSFTGELLEEIVSYDISLRAIGQIVKTGSWGNQKIKYVLSSKEVLFKLSKLGSMDVEVNKYGVFTWKHVANADGFMVNLASTNQNYVCRDGGVSTSYESTFEGYYNYQFKALGSNGAINLQNTQKVYYLNSVVNNNQLGLLATNLPALTDIWVEDGVIKFKPLGLINSIQPEGLRQVVGYKLTIDNGIGEIYTTNLGQTVFYSDAAGNLCFDFTEFGYATIYNLKIQPYIYYVNPEQTLFENAQISNSFDGQNYHLLLGGKLGLIFEKATAPTNLHIENGDVVWSGADDTMFNIEISTETTVVLSEWTNQKSWWSHSNLILPNVNYYVKVKAFKDGFVYSCNAIYLDAITGNMKIVNKLSSIDLSFNTYSKPDGSTFISFDYPTGTLDIGFNLMFKQFGAESFNYVTISHENYNNIISYLNGTATISLQALAQAFGLDGIEQMQYAIQIVPKGESSYLKSDYSALSEFSIPDKIENIYYSAENFEYYWQYAGASYSYVVNDEILDAEGNVLAVYRYKIKSDNITSEKYYKERQIEIGGTIRTVGTISYLPSVSGFNHRVSVAVCLDTSATQSLMSLFQTAEQTCTLTVLTAQTNVFDASSPIFGTINNTQIVAYLQNNAYGSAANPYLVANEADFANINYRLQRYAYTMVYEVELFYSFGGNSIHKTLNITETNAQTYTFKQTADLTLTNIAIGAITTTQSGTITYEYFDNTYDAGEFTITYSFNMATMTLARTNFNVALFYGIGTNGVVKNLKLNANIDFAAKASSIISFGSVAAVNKGTIQNVQLLNLQIQRIVDSNAIGTKTLTFGGIVGENLGKIILCKTNELNISISIANNGDAVYVGGIAAKNTGGIIMQAGNNVNFTVVGKTLAYVGGLSGFNTGAIVQSYNKATIVASCTNANSNTYIGGLAAFNDASGGIKNSYFVGNLSSPSYVSTNGSHIYIGGLAAYTKSAIIENNFTNMAEIRNQGVAVCGTVVGQIAVTISPNFLLTNYYVNNSAYGGTQSAVPSKFLAMVSLADLQQYSTVLNNKAGEIIFKTSAEYPVFIWESRFL